MVVHYYVHFCSVPILLLIGIQIKFEYCALSQDILPIYQVFCSQHRIQKYLNIFIHTAGLIFTTEKIADLPIHLTSNTLFYLYNVLLLRNQLCLPDTIHT